MPEKRIPSIGIAGGVASGKSLIAEQLRRKGAAVVAADQLAHEVLNYDEVRRQARARWGEGIFRPDGRIDRVALAKIVFAPPPDGPDELRFLEQLIHPEVGRLARQQVERLNQENNCPAIVLDIPLLFESGWNKFCDKVLFVDAPRATRLKRALARGWSEEDFVRREACQESPETKERLADVVIDNSGSVEAVQAQIEHLWKNLVGSPPTA